MKWRRPSVRSERWRALARAVVQAAREGYQQGRKARSGTKRTAPAQDTAIVAEGDVALSERPAGVPFRVILRRRGPGQVVFLLDVGGRTYAEVPFDNLVKAATRIDPAHATVAEQQIRRLREELATALGRAVEAEARWQQAREKGGSP